MDDLDFVPSDVKLKASQVKVVRLEMLKKQKYICPLCNTKITADMACLDHDHKTGHIRAVLCRNCNGIEGRIFNLATRAKRKGTERSWLKNLVTYHELYSIPKTNLIHPTYKPVRTTTKRTATKRTQK